MSRKHFKRRIVLTILIFMFSTTFFTGCYNYYYFDVKIGDVRFSPIYQLEIQNKTSQILTFLPRDGVDPRIKPKKIDGDGFFTTHLQIKEIMIGQTLTREVVTGPYIDSGQLGPNTGLIRYKDGAGRKREFQIDLENKSWFNGYQKTVFTPDKKEPRTLKVELTNDEVNRDKEIKWFLKGPDNPFLFFRKN